MMPNADLISTAGADQAIDQPSVHANKVLVIGLDGATFDLIKPWAAAGLLPTLQKLMTSGAHGSLRSTVPP
ncbi:MAG: alkaline phosphatase family protein, partial [Chloroflexota bacterium]|nr:alkaline phosphatase family protein [Chloroflexota bacterium]